MNDEAFLEAIRAERDSDVPRLVYSDWLEEHGEPDRAAFIRLQCELARLHPGDKAYDSIQQLASELLLRRRDEWIGPWAPSLVKRGFLDVTCHLYSLLQLTPEHLAAPLLLDLTLAAETPKRADLVGLDRHPALERVTRLSLGGLFDDQYADLLYILGASYPKLDTLLLPFFPGDRMVLRALERMPSLKRLHLTQRYWNNAPQDDDWQAVFAAPFLANVRELHLADQSLGAVSAGYLARSPYLRQLTRLNLSGNRIGAAGVHALAESENLSQVTDLDLTANRVRDSGVRALALSRFTGNLHRLRLAENEIGGPGVRAILDSDGFGRLKRLSLDKNYIGNSTALAIAEAPLLEQITHLSLGQDLGDEAIAAIAQSKLAAQLEALDFTGNRITDRALEALADSTSLRALHRLRLCSPLIREDGLLTLLASPLGAQLRELEAPMCPVSVRRIHAVMSHPQLRYLKRLRVTADASSDIRSRLRRQYAPRLDC